MAFLLALALVVSVMSGLGLSVSAEQESNTPGTEEVQQQDKTEAGAAPSEVKAEEEAAKPEEKPVLEEKEDEQKTEAKENADKPAEKQEKATPKAGENVQTATIGTGDKTVTVKTTAAAGVLPEGAKLVVKKLADKDQAYQDAESTLKDSQVTYDDFLALDVGFEVNGKEVEPEAGSVQVQFELGAGLLPETADTSTLAVQHLTDGKAETVADAGAVTAGDVTVNGEVIKADFEVKSFSNFTITWTIREKNWWNTYFKKYFELTVTYLDEEGKEINPSASNVELTNDKEINFFKTYDKSITGYDFVGAYYGSYTKGVETTKITSLETSTEGYDNYNRTYSIYFYRDGSRVDAYTLTQNQVTDSTDVAPKTANIKLVFKKDTTGDTGGTIGDITLPAPGHTKKAVSKGDGTYDLSLDVSGSIGSEAKKVPLDVVMIIDRSGSMNNNERIKKVQEAANKLIDGLSNNNNLDVNYNIVTFSSLSTTAGEYSVSEDDAKTYGWTESADVAKGNINGITATGGTNYQAGIRLAKKQLNLARSGVQTAVIFFTDGIPTFRLSNPYAEGGGIYYGNGQDDSGSRNINAAVDEIKGMYTNRFYAIGTSGANKDNLNSLSNGVNASDKKVYAIDDKDIGTTFDAIEKEINKLTCTKVSITDTLNENAQIVKTADGKTPLTITVTDKDGKVIDKKSGAGEVTLTLKETEQNKGEVADRTLTATYVEKNGERKIKLIFPDAYSLEADYTYTVTTPIEPTERAYEKYRGKGETYPNTPDAGTGTHDKEMGFYCNDTAQLKYDNGKGDKTVDYDKPVIQLTPGKLVIEKTIAGELTDEQVKALEDTLTFKYTLNGSTEQSTQLTGWTKDETNGTYTARKTVATGLSPNTTYTVTESGAEVENYDVDTKTENVTGTVNKGATAVASFTNTYTPSNRTITLKKVVTGNMGDKDRSFTFSATKATLGKTSLKDSETTTITAKVGENVTITETDPGSYTVSAAGVEDGEFNEKENSYTFTVTKDMNTNTVITFTNTKTIQPPNGITTTIAPYAIMVVLAAGAGVYFVYSRRRRNR